MRTIIVLASVLLAPTAAPALADDANNANKHVCLQHRDVDGWGARDKQSMVVNDRFGRKYLVSLSGFCDDLNFAMGVGFQSIGGGFLGSCIERGDHVIMRGVGVTFPDSTCWVKKVQPYTPEIQEADKLAKSNHQPLSVY